MSGALSRGSAGGERDPGGVARPARRGDAAARRGGLPAVVHGARRGRGGGRRPRRVQAAAGAAAGLGGGPANLRRRLRDGEVPKVKERTIEQAAVRKLRVEGLEALKVGDQGWPDRLVLLGAGRHVWIEFKAPGGRLRPAQKRRIEALIAKRETVLTVESAEGALTAVRLLRRLA